MILNDVAGGVEEVDRLNQIVVARNDRQKRSSTSTSEIHIPIIDAAHAQTGPCDSPTYIWNQESPSSPKPLISGAPYEILASISLVAAFNQ